MIAKIRLPDNKEGYFDFQGQATNLGLADINDDNIPEILAPSYDQRLEPHLNVYSFDPNTKAFRLLNN